MERGQKVSSLGLGSSMKAGVENEGLLSGGLIWGLTAWGKGQERRKAMHY